MDTIRRWLGITGQSQIHHPAEMFLLSTFLTPRRAEDLPVMARIDWEKALGEDPLNVTQRLQKNGLIERADLLIHLDQCFKADELRAMLKARGIAAPAKKSAMMVYLIQADENGMWKDVGNVKILVCSDRGVALVKQYLAQVKKNQKVTPGKARSTPDHWLGSMLKWIILAAVGGVIGNRADDAILWMARDINQLMGEDEETSPPESPDDAQQGEDQFPTATPDLVPLETSQPTSTPEAQSTNDLDETETPEPDQNRPGQQQKTDKGKPDDVPDVIDRNLILVPISAALANEIILQQSLDDPSASTIFETANLDSNAVEVDFEPDAAEVGEGESDLDNRADDDLDFDHDTTPDFDGE